MVNFLLKTTDMNLSHNNKILLAIAIGGGIAYALHRSNKSKDIKTTLASNGKVDAENPTTREGKIEYILANAETTSTEEKSGFTGERFAYNSKLGYLMPIGNIKETDSGAEMILPREGDLAQEVFFNAEGDTTDDPTEEAVAILNELTDEELDIAYKATKARKNNPQLSASEVAKKIGLQTESKKMFADIILPRLNDIKALRKSKKWKEKWQQRKQRFQQRVQGQIKGIKSSYNKNDVRSIDKQIPQDIYDKCRATYDDKASFVRCVNKAVEGRRRKCTQIHRDKRAVAKCMSGKGKGRGLSDISPRRTFAQQVTNRKEGSMWGGHRNDGNLASLTASV